MSEKFVMLPTKQWHFSGPFHFKRIINSVQETLESKGYSCDDGQHDISVASDNKSHTIKYSFTRTENKYDNAVISVKITAKGKPCVVIYGTQSFNGIDGSVSISFTGTRKSQREFFYIEKEKGISYFIRRMFRIVVKKNTYDFAAKSIPSDVNAAIESLEQSLSQGKIRNTKKTEDLEDG